VSRYTGGLLKTGTQTLTLSGTNTFTGPTRVQAGVLAVSYAASLGRGSLEIADAAKLRLDDKGTRQVAALSVAGKDQPPDTYGSAGSNKGKPMKLIAENGKLATLTPVETKQYD